MTEKQSNEIYNLLRKVISPYDINEMLENGKTIEQINNKFFKKYVKISNDDLLQCFREWNYWNPKEYSSQLPNIDLRLNTLDWTSLDTTTRDKFIDFHEVKKSNNRYGQYFSIAKDNYADYEVELFDESFLDGYEMLVISNDDYEQLTTEYMENTINWNSYEPFNAIIAIDNDKKVHIISDDTADELIETNNNLWIEYDKYAKSVFDEYTDDDGNIDWQSMHLKTYDEYYH